MFNMNCEKMLISLGRTAEKYGKHYCFPSQETILQNLRTNYSISISRRTLNYVLRYLEDKKLILRKRRVRRLPGGQWRQNTTLYTLTSRAWGYLARAWNSLKKLFRGFRVQPFAHHKNSQGSDIRGSSFSPKKEEPPPPKYWEVSPGYEGYSEFKAFIKAL